MRELSAQTVTDAVERLCMEVCYHLPADVRCGLANASKSEPWPNAAKTLEDLLENARIADEGVFPLCQDTGMACVFIELGQEVHFVGTSLQQAVDEGVRRGYANGYLRKSIVGDPLRRTNTLDNTPALLHVDITAGNACTVTVLAKGFGSENMSRIKMLNPSEGAAGVADFVLDAVQSAGGNPCPPIVVGVGIGSSFDGVALLAKRALLREIGSVHTDPFYARMESELFARINGTGIGPQGFGGKTTALAVHILAAPTHIAALPVAVNINCHATRRASVAL